MRAAANAALLALFAPGALSLATARQQESALVGKNPIRKVVTLLESLQNKITAEGKQEQALFDKYICYCKTNNGALDSSIVAAQAKIESLEADLKSSAEKKAQTEQDLKDHQGSRSDAKQAIAQATALREKEAAEYAKLSAENKANIGALTKAVAAVDKGSAGFLQTSAAQLVRRFALEKADVPDQAREAVLSFLSGSAGQGYAPKSGQIVGILRQLLDSLVTSDEEAAATEASALASFQALLAAKKKEVEALTAQIEAEQLRLGELGVFLATAANDLSATQTSLTADSKFKIELQQGCATKEAEWEEIKKTRAEELLAVAETIKALNDDDALDLFNKALPVGSSFVQLQQRTAAVKARALSALREAEVSGTANGKLPAQPALDLIELALSGKKIGFEKVLTLIDDLVANLHKEQSVDDSKKEYCNAQLDVAEDKAKELERSAADSATAIADIEGTIAELKEAIQTLSSGIKELDSSVATATAQREKEHSDYTELVASNNAAKDLLLWAKNRLNKFYNPKLYKPEAKTELSAADRISTNMGVPVAMLQVSMHSFNGEAPPPPPEAPGKYSKKSQESTGVIAMIDLLIADLDKQSQEGGVDEKNAQQSYERLMADSAAKRTADSNAVTEKESSVAALEEALQAEKDKKKGSEKQLAATLEVIKALHGECDWLLQHFDVRKEARQGEIESLGKAKAVLSGADYSLLQTRSRSAAFLAPMP